MSGMLVMNGLTFIMLRKTDNTNINRKKEATDTGTPQQVVKQLITDPAPSR